MTSVLIVEDEESLADPLAFLLRKEGFEATVMTDGPAALAEFDRAGADIVLLDLMLPGMSGTDVCKQLRARSSVPVIMVTARDSEIDKVVGLEIGADDYLTKPFSPRELRARAMAMMRRPRSATASPARTEPASLMQLGELSVDVESRVATLADVELELTRTEFDLLAALLGSPRRVWTRDALFRQVWGTDWVGDGHLVEVHMGNLRRKLGDDSHSGRWIRTVRGVGYRLGSG